MSNSRGRSRAGGGRYCHWAAETGLRQADDGGDSGRGLFCGLTHPCAHRPEQRAPHPERAPRDAARLGGVPVHFCGAHASGDPVPVRRHHRTWREYLQYGFSGGRLLLRVPPHAVEIRTSADCRRILLRGSLRRRGRAADGAVAEFQR